MMAVLQYQADPEVVTCELNGGVALLDLRTSTYFSLNPVGAFIWTTLQAPVASAEICEAVASEFDVTVDRCRPDVDGLLQDLKTRGLARAVDA